MNSSGKIRVLIWGASAEDCQKYVQLLKECGEVAVIGFASQQEISVSELKNPDVLLFIGELTYQAPGNEFSEARELSVPILFMSQRKEATAVWQALEEGARGYALSDIDSQQLVAALISLAHGHIWLDKRILPMLADIVGHCIKMDYAKAKTQISEFMLSAKEMHLIYLLGEGFNTGEIAQLMSEPEFWVCENMSQVIRKMAKSHPESINHPSA